MIEFELTTSHNATLRAEMYSWIKQNTTDAKLTAIESRIIIFSVKLNEQDAVAFKLRFGL